MEIKQPEQEATLIAQWQEPVVNNSVAAHLPRPLLLGGTVALIVILILTGYFQKDKTYYFASVVVFAAFFALTGQQKLPNREAEVTITDLFIQVGRRYIPLTELAGFWFEMEQDHLLINFETSKNSLIPLNAIYPSVNTEEARALLLQVLPELEGRDTGITDRITHFLR